MTSWKCWMLRLRAPITYTTITFFLSAICVPAQDDTFPVPPPPGVPPPAAPPGGASEKLILLNFRDSPLDQILEFVADLMGRTLIKSPGINATITLKSQTRLTVSESLEAIEAVLAMNNVSLVPMGTKFLKVVQTAAARQEGMPVILQNAENSTLPENDQLISQVVALQHMEIAEAQPIIQSLIHGYGKIQPLDRTNSMLITDTASNLKRILEILEYIDQPTESKVETRIYELRYAEAGQVAGKLNELIADSQAKEDKPRVETGAASNAPQPPPIPGVIRARPPGVPESGDAGSAASAEAEAGRGLIRGKVKIIADDRTGILFVVSRPENFAFFDKIVAVLDRPIEADIGVRVVPLEYAKAEDIAGILNEFIGAASSEKKAGTTAQPGQTEGQQGSRQLDEVVRAAEVQLQQAQATLQEARGEKGVIGRLSPETKILADKRTNSLLLMGRKSDLDALELVLDSLDIMLAQVLIETVILEVNLGDTVETGFDWLQRSVVAYNERQAGPGSGITIREPVLAFGGGQVVDSGTFRGGDKILDRSDTGIGAGGLSYYLTMTDLNLDAIIRLAGQSSDARVVSTPVVLTTDNTEAKIVAAEQRPVVTSTSTQTTGQQTQNFEYRNIGITITVTPRINPSGFVMMEVSQNADDVLSEVPINNTPVPIIGKREISAQIGVQSRSTIVLGGLVRTDNSKSRTKVPVLGDIPLLGALFRADTKRKNRTELLVLLTPYVLKTPDEAITETKRLYHNSRNESSPWHKGWSDSTLPKKAITVKSDGTMINATPEEGERERPRRETLLNTFGFEETEDVKPPAKVIMESDVVPEAVVEPEPEIVPEVEPEPAAVIQPEVEMTEPPAELMAEAPAVVEIVESTDPAPVLEPESAPEPAVEPVPDEPAVESSDAPASDAPVPR